MMSRSNFRRLEVKTAPFRLSKGQAVQQKFHLLYRAAGTAVLGIALDLHIRASEVIKAICRCRDHCVDITILHLSQTEIINVNTARLGRIVTAVDPNFGGILKPVGIRRLPGQKLLAVQIIGDRFFLKIQLDPYPVPAVWFIDHIASILILKGSGGTS